MMNTGVQRYGAFPRPQTQVDPPTAAAFNEMLGRLTSLEELHLSSVNGATLQTVGHIPNLQKLDVSDAGLRDDTLDGLQGMVHLRVLRMGGHEITDAGLAHLTNLKQLEELDLAGNQITGLDLTA